VGNQGIRITAAFAEPAVVEGALQTALGHSRHGAICADVAVRSDKWKSNRASPHAEWHFVDTPLGKTYDAHRDCPFSDCVTDRVTQFATS